MEETGGSTAKNGQNETMFLWARCRTATVRSGYERVDHTSQEQWLFSIYKNDHNETKCLAAEKGIEDFTGSPSQCHRFMKRCGLAMSTKTSTAQKMPIEYESKIVSFQKFVLDARKKNGFEISPIGNMDEVPLTFDVPSNKTVDVKGAKTITVKTSGHDKTH